MFRCAGVVLVLALAFFAWEVPAEPLDGAGIIGGEVRSETTGGPLGSAIVTAYQAGTTIPIDDDITDSRGRYTLLIPLDGQDADTVDVKADKSGYIAKDTSNIIVEFLEVETLDFVLEQQAQIITGAVFDSVFGTAIESVYVSAESDEMSADTHTDSNGRYLLEGLAADTYDISFTHPDFLPEDHTVTIVIPDPPYVPPVYPLYDTLEQVIWHVETTGDDLNGDGRKWSPFATIQTGIDSASMDDTVLVGPGTYGTETEEGISFKGKQIVVMSDSMAGPELTIVGCSGQGRGFVFENGEDWLSVLRGFTIRDGRTAGSGGAILCRGGSPTIEDCIVESNYASDRGGGIAVQTETTSPVFRHCIIRDNSARERGGGIYCFEYCNPSFENCTVFGNSADSTSGKGGGISSIMCDATITKCIIWGNSDYYLGQSTDQIDTATSVPLISYSDIQSEEIWGGTDNINYHPLFCNPDESDLYLAANSPCYDYPPISPENIGALGMGCDTLGVIYGVVVDSATRAPILEVEVVASDFDGISETRTHSTDINGYYELPLPIIPNEINTADVEFSHPAYVDFTVYDVVFVAGYSTELDTAMVSGCEYIPGDCNCSGSPLELDDVMAMIGYYRGTESPCFTCACPPHGDYFAAVADPDGNCVAYQLADLQQMIGAYRGTCLAYGCVDCPGSGSPPPPGKEGPLMVPSLRSKARVDGSELTR